MPESYTRIVLWAAVFPPVALAIVVSETRYKRALIYAVGLMWLGLSVILAIGSGIFLAGVILANLFVVVFLHLVIHSSRKSMIFYLFLNAQQKKIDFAEDDQKVAEYPSASQRLAALAQCAILVTSTVALSYFIWTPDKYSLWLAMIFLLCVYFGLAIFLAIKPQAAKKSSLGDS